MEAGLILKRLYSAHGSDGKTYEVHVYARPADPAEAAHIEHLAKICTAEGEALKVLGHGRYEIVETGVRLTTSDPQAI